MLRTDSTGWDESREQAWSDPQTGLSKNFWGRGMGWYAMALVDVLDYFPKDHPKYLEIIEIVDEMAEAIKAFQDDKTGVWYQVLDQDDREGNYLESSGSSMFVYFLVKAVRLGYIDESYMEVAMKGYDGINTQFISLDENGLVEITNACAGAGLGGNPYRDGTYEYYINESVRSNDPKAVGPYIYLLIELAKYESKVVE
jgi:unsaturated rhamnogalacturonyl hydrolase